VSAKINLEENLPSPEDGNMNFRALTKTEIALARTVFKETIKWDKVQVVDIKGASNREFTTPDFNPLKWGTFNIHMGPVAYRKGCDHGDPRDVATFIHELTHVWQGMNSGWAWNYVCNSLWHQATMGDSAYDYGPIVGAKVHGKVQPTKWSQYNVEMQAKIVEDWFAGRTKSKIPKDHKDWRYRFIRDNILAKKSG
jgi:hypothetical protein